MGVRVTLDKAAVKARVEAASRKATIIVANELLKDSNYYCREDSGELKRSAIRASKLEEGKLIWNTPYAKRMYYIGNPVKDKNRNASLMWAQKAADNHREKYIKMAQKAVKEEV
jgi:hypothetical protein